MKNNRINIEYDLYPFDLRDAFYNSMYDNNTKDILNDIVLEIMDYLTIVEEIFEAINDDERTHYIALEGPDRKSEHFLIPDTFSLEK